MGSELKTIRLSEKAGKILEIIPEKKGISKNQFINECIEAYNIPTSRRNKINYATQIITLTNLSLLEMSTGYKQTTDSLKQTVDLLERSIGNNGNFKRNINKKLWV